MSNSIDLGVGIVCVFAPECCVKSAACSVIAHRYKSDARPICQGTTVLITKEQVPAYPQARRHLKSCYRIANTDGRRRTQGLTQGKRLSTLKKSGLSTAEGALYYDY